MSAPEPETGDGCSEPFFDGAAEEFENAVQRAREGEKRQAAQCAFVGMRLLGYDVDVSFGSGSCDNVECPAEATIELSLPNFPDRDRVCYCSTCFGAARLVMVDVSKVDGEGSDGA